ncbi:hypothetical protein C1646_663619 [Rhizophagus diaphanus]|nr:hypothetical protein C1646_663619 [Rhizophagus diaphanus] [Rhizophagus sp. MUCL 43196]
MSLFFTIFITFLCPFVSAQLPENDYSQEAFSGYFDVLINFMVPFVIFVMVDFDYDKEGSKIVAQLVRSLIYFLLVGMQQELAFTFSSVKVSNFIKVLQHIVVALLLIEIIGEFILSITKEKSSTRNPLNNKKSSSTHERKVEPLLNKSESKISISSSADRDTKTTIKKDEQSEEKENGLKPEPKILISSSADRDTETTIENDEQSEEKEYVIKIEPRILISSSADRYIDEIYEQPEEKENELKPEPMILISSSADRYIDEIYGQPEEKENGLKPEPKILISSSADRYTENAIELKPEPVCLILSSADKDTKTTTENDEQSEEKENELKPEPKILISSSVIDWIMGNKSIFIRTLFLIDYTSLILFIILLGFLLNDLKEIITRNFVIALAISFTLTFIVQSTILIVANRGSKFNNYIVHHHQVYYKIFPKYHAYITIVIDMTITNVVYFPSLINYFLLQTPDIFNKIFLNVSALFVSSLVMHMYKIILKNEEMEKKGEKVDERRKGSEDYV